MPTSRSLGNRSNAFRLLLEASSNIVHDGLAGNTGFDRQRQLSVILHG
jgi:hypothetical protein